MSRKPVRKSATEARSGDIVLRKRWQKIVFLSALVLFVLIVLLSALF